jgi:hypothetical protein
MAKRSDMVAYCGLYCGTCPAYTGSLAGPARELRDELRRNKCDKAASRLARIPGLKAFEHYEQLDALLVTLAKMRCANPCRVGGGSAQCRIRKCVRSKNLAGCWQCEGFAACTTLQALEEYGDIDRTYLKNLGKIKRHGVVAFARMQRLHGKPKA